MQRNSASTKAQHTPTKEPNTPLQDYAEQMSPQQRLLALTIGDQAIDSIYESMKASGHRLSELSMTKYRHLINKGAHIIHPPVQLRENKSQFISQDELLNLDKSLLEQMEQQGNLQSVRERLFNNNSQHSYRRSMDQSASGISIGYGPMEEIKFQLGHNKSQMQMQRKAEESLILTSIARKPSLMEKLPKIKQYPSRVNQQGVHEPVPKKQPSNTIELVDGTIIPTQHMVWIEKFYGRWRPQIREGATLSCIQSKYYLIGGISSTAFNDANVWSNNEWQSIEVIAEKPSFGRTYHCAGVYRRMIYVFGGEKPYDNQQKLRECLNDFRCFNTENNEYRIVRTSGDSIEGRRGAASTFLGRHMIIMGGISTKIKYLSDVFHLDTAQNKVQYATIDPCNYFVEGIAFHTMVAVYNSNKMVQLYKSNLEVEESKEQRQKVEGIYVYGGEDKNGKLYTDMFMLNSFQRPMSWIKCNSRGVAPLGRYKHSCVFMERQGMIVIYGGISEDSRFLNDCHVFRVEYQAWCNIVMDYQEPRAGHSAVLDDHQMMIFGGYNETGFLAAEIKWLELDSLIAIRFQREGILMTSRAEKEKEKVLPRQLSKKAILIEDIKLQQIRNKIEKLQFQNQKSFLPMPSSMFKQKTTQALLGRIQSKKEQLLLKTINADTQHLVGDIEDINQPKLTKQIRSVTMKNVLSYNAQQIS